mmetsp:Transcript_31170/g.27557  ORF Transcript_31170/g.27557 Transcript_31170/m.27557 type:complete len:148 (-) Transcript_31170:364-807(-)
MTAPKRSIIKKESTKAKIIRKFSLDFLAVKKCGKSSESTNSESDKSGFHSSSNSDSVEEEGLSYLIQVNLPKDTGDCKLTDGEDEGRLGEDEISCIKYSTTKPKFTKKPCCLAIEVHEKVDHCIKIVDKYTKKQEKVRNTTGVSKDS